MDRRIDIEDEHEVSVATLAYVRGLADHPERRTNQRVADLIGAMEDTGTMRSPPTSSSDEGTITRDFHGFASDEDSDMDPRPGPATHRDGDVRPVQGGEQAPADNQMPRNAAQDDLNEEANPRAIEEPADAARDYAQAMPQEPVPGPSQTPTRRTRSGMEIGRTPAAPRKKGKAIKESSK